MSEETTPTTAEGEHDAKVPGTDIYVWIETHHDETDLWICRYGGPTGCVFPAHDDDCPLLLMRRLERELGEARVHWEALRNAAGDHYAIERTPDEETCYQCHQSWPCAIGWAFINYDAARERARAALLQEPDVKIADTDWADHEEIRGLPVSRFQEPGDKEQASD